MRTLQLFVCCIRFKYYPPNSVKAYSGNLTTARVIFL